MTPVSQSYILHQLTELDSIQQQVATLLQSHQIANEIQQDLRLIMDEIISNVFHYSHQGASCLVLLNITLTDHYCGLNGRKGLEFVANTIQNGFGRRVAGLCY